MIVLLLAISHVRASFSDPGEMVLQQEFAKFILDWKLLQMENLSDMNLVKDKFPVSNLFVYFSVQVDKNEGQKTCLRWKALLNSC